LGEEIVETGADGTVGTGADGIDEPGRVYVSIGPIGVGL
jgi:hypothetical protein